MFLEIFLFIFYTFFCLFSVLGYGIIFKKFIYKPSDENLAENGFFGFLLLFFISLFFHFFIPLSYWFNLIILTLGFIISCKSFIQIKNAIAEIKIYFFISTLIILPSIFIVNTHADYDWYHLPYVNYLNNFKIIFGLVNLSNNYTYGHGWMDIMGIFSLPIVQTKGLSIISSIFFYFFILYLVFEIKKTQIKSVKIFAIILIVYSFANFNKLADFEAEIQPSIILFILILNILKLLHNNNFYNRLAQIALYVFFAIILRIGSIIILPIVLIIFLLNLKYVSKSIINYIKLYSFLILFFIFFLLKNFIVSGCLSYPIYKTCFDNNHISWASPIENVKERFEFIVAISKRWKFYSMEVANLETRFEYFTPMNNNIILDPAAYNHKKLFWFKYWSRDHDIARLLNSILMILFCFISYAILSKHKLSAFKSLNITSNHNNFIHLGFFFSILMWLFLSPQMRYGGHPVIGGSLIFYTSIIVSRFKISKKNFNFVVIFLLVLSTSYFLSKNITRIAKILDKNQFTQFPWPKYSSKTLGVDYKTVKINNIELNLILTSENMIKGEPMMCGNVEMLCLPGERIACISNIDKRYDYIFIENNNPKCLKQFRENYWQH